MGEAYTLLEGVSQSGRDLVEKEVAVLFMFCYMGVKRFNDIHDIHDLYMHNVWAGETLS